MALKNFIIGLDFRFGASAKAAREFEKANLIMENFHDNLQSINKIQDFGSDLLTNLKSLNDVTVQTPSNISAMSDSYQQAVDELEEFNQYYADLLKNMNRTDSDMRYVTQAIDRFSSTINTSEDILENYSGAIKQLSDTLVNEYSNKLGIVGGATDELTIKTNEFKKNLVKAFTAQDLTAMNNSIQNGIKSFQVFDNELATSKGLAKFEAQSTSVMNEINKNLGEKAFKATQSAFNNFNEDLQRFSPEQLERITPIIVEINQAIRKGEHEKVAKLANEYHNLTGRLDRAQQAADRLKDGLRSMVQGPLGDLTAAIGLMRVFTDAIESQGEAMHDIVRMNINQADSRKENTKALFEYSNAMVEVGEATNVSLVRAQQQMNALARIRVSGTVEELAELSKTAIDMQHAFGISESAAAEFAKNLVMIGGLAVDNVRPVANELANVQESLGLTEQEATEAGAQIGKMIRQLSAFGDVSQKEAAIVAREVGKMTAAFTKAGMSAQDASQMLDKLMDPDKLTENTLLFTKMGISASDAFRMMSGEGEVMEGMTERMVQVAKDLKSQFGGNVYALKSMAEAHGMSLSQVQQLSKLSKEDLETQKEEAALAQQAAETRDSMREKIKELGAQLNILIQRFVLPLLNILTQIAKGVVWIVDQVDKLGPVFKTVIGVVLTGMLVTKGALFKLIAGSTKLFGVFKRLVTGPLGLMKKLFTDARGTVKGIADQIKNVAQNAQKTGGALGEAGDTARNKALQKQSALTKNQMKLESSRVEKLRALSGVIKSIRPAQILAVAVALLALGAAISLIVLSITQLAKVMDDWSPGEMLAFLIPMIVLVIGFLGMLIPIIGALGAISAAAAPGLLAAAVAIFAIGAAVAVVILSFSVLVNAIANLFTMISESQGTFAELIAKFAAASVGLLMFAAAALAAAPMILAFGLTTMFVAPFIMMLGTGFFFLGAGLKLVAEHGEKAVTSLSSIAETASILKDVNISGFTKQLLALGMTAYVAAPGLMMLGGSFLFLGIGAKLVAENAEKAGQALATLNQNMPENIDLSGIIGPILKLGIVSLIAAPGIMLLAANTRILASSLEIIKNSAAEASEGLRQFVETLPDPSRVRLEELGDKINEFIGDIRRIGRIQRLGTAMFMLGTGLKQVADYSAAGIQSLADSLNDLPDPDDLNLTALSTQLNELAGRRRVSIRISRMGTGLERMASAISTMKNDLGTVVSKLEDFKAFFADNNLANLSATFVNELDKISNRLQRLKIDVGSANAALEKTVNQTVNVNTKAAEQQTKPIVEELQTANTHLEDIKAAIGKTNEILEKNTRGNMFRTSTTQVTT